MVNFDMNVTKLFSRRLGDTMRRVGMPGLRGVACALLAALLGLGACVRDAHATSTPITTGTAANYGLLVGVGKSDTVNLSGNNAISGSAYEDSGVTTNYSGSTAISGGLYTQSMAQAITDATTASTSANALKATSGLTDQGGSITSSVTISALTNLSENVLDISSVSLTNGTITFNDNGYTNAKFIINVSGNFSLSNVTIKTTNGASADDIIFNIEGTGKTVSITGGTTLGTILVPASNVTVGGGGSLTGELMAGFNNAGKSYTVNEQSNGYNITSLGYTPRSVVPEPSSIALFGAGCASLAWLRRRQRRS
jgi:hypothetical protein